jgi:sugar phosphate isomerase/epimerase
MERREAIKGIGMMGGMGMLMGSGCVGNKEEEKWEKNGLRRKREIKLGFQEDVAPGETLREKIDFMERLGVKGLEPGGWGIGGRVKELREAIEGREVEISAVCAGYEGFILSSDERIRKRFDETMKEIIRAAGELGAVGVIMVPAFRSQEPVMGDTIETRGYLVDELEKLGFYAEGCGTTVILEALNRREAWYLRQVGDAGAICREVNRKGVRCMGDFWHMTREEVSDEGAMMSGGEYLAHVHVASRVRRLMPGEDGVMDDYREGFRGLKAMGYEGYVSFECGCEGADKRRAAAVAVGLLRDQWEKA